MNEVEKLLMLDRNAPMPDVPDASFTAAVVAKRSGRLSADSVPRSEADGMILVAAAFVGVGLICAAWLGDFRLLALLLAPSLLVPLFPIIRKGVR